MKIQLSIAIITYNEEKNIRRTLEAVLPIADEIVIVDSFSTDKTKDIALEYNNVHFIEHPFTGHIEQKNFALEQVENLWVLSIDADEVLSPKLRKSIAKIMEHPIADGYRFNRLTNYCGHWVKHCGWYPDTKLRLVKKNNAIWRGKNPHDRLEVLEGNQLVHLKGDLLHYSYDSAEQHYRQIEYFGEIASQTAFKNGKKTNWFTIYAKTVFQFIKSFLLRLGFLDGKTGWLVSKRSAYATFVKYTKLLTLQRKNA